MEDMIYDNIKSHKKTGLDPFSEKEIFEKTTGGRGVKLTPPAFLELSIIQFFNAAKLLYTDSFFFSMFSINLFRRYAKIW